MSQVETRRHDGITPSILYSTPMHVIGVGGVGSHVVELTRMQLGKRGITLYDGDIVEAHNPPSQQFTRDHIGLPKVEALRMQAEIWSDGNVPIHTNFDMVKEPIPLAGIVFLCLDNMQARKDICKQSLFSNKDVLLVAETRMDASVAEVWMFNPNNSAHEKWWLHYWYPDEDAQNEVGCGGHYAVPTATSITASMAVQAVINYFRLETQELIPNRVRLNLRTWGSTTRTWPTET